MHPRLLTLSVLLLAGASPAQIAAYHDQSLAQHQSQIATLRPQGYRMIALTSYDSAASPLFAAVWVRRNGPTQVPFSSVDGNTYQNLFNTYAGQGYTVRFLSIHGSGSSTRFTGVFEVDNKPFWATHDLTAAQFDEQCSNARNQGYIATSAAVYGTSAAPLFGGVWTRNDDRVDWTWTHAGTPGDYQLYFNAATQGWLRPAIAAPSSWGRYLAILHDTQLTGGWAASHNMTSAGYQSAFNTQWNAGNYPIDVHAAGSGSSARFAAVFAPNETVAARQFSTTGTTVAGLSAFDTWVQNLMQSTNTRGASLSVVKDGRLVLSRGYTFAEPGYPSTLPTSSFRIASMSKPITSTAVHRALQGNPGLTIDRSVLSFFPPIAPLDPRTAAVTLRNCLNHAGGWDISVLGFDPQFYDAQIASYFGTPLPITTNQIYRYMTLTKMLQFAPGMGYAYSNYGFDLCGRVLESLNPGMTYEQIVQRDVFTPLGVTRARIGGSTLAQVAPGEVRYHPSKPGIARSVMSDARPLVPGQYGGWNQGNHDANGGWIMATPDFAAMLASFALGNQSPVLNQSFTNQMWSYTPGLGSNVLRGWFSTYAGQGRYLRQHNGGLAGTATCGVVRSDNVGFVLFLNRDTSIGDTQYLQLSQIADGVTDWPNHDLFPSVGIPSLRSHVQGAYSTYGTACSGSSGPALHTGAGTPEIDQTMTLRTFGGPLNGIGIAFVGTSRTTWNAIPLPLSLTGAGAPGCNLLAAPHMILTHTINASGVGTTNIDLPADPALIDAHLYSQVAPIDPAANTLGLSFSNGLDTRIGGWR